MSATKLNNPQLRFARPRENGGYAVEFAIVVLIFLSLTFGILELARSMYLVNTLQEVTRRAAASAANANVSSAEVMQRIREYAVLRQSPGVLALGAPVTDQHVRIDFLALVADSSGQTSMEPATSISTCPVKNRLNCMNNPNSPSCIRFVRARICEPGAGVCTRATYETIFPLVEFAIPLPLATTIVPVESLGYQPGMALCP